MRARFALLVVLALSAGACAKATDGTGSGGADAGGKISLQVESAGGFVPSEYALRTIPEFTLTPDGLTIATGPQIEIYPPPAMPSLVSRTLTPTAISRIVAEAEAAGLNGPDKRYEYMNVSDAPTTTFTYKDRGGVTHTISVYALGMDQEEGAPEPAGASAEEKEARAKLAKLREKLLDLGSWIDKSEIGEEQQYAFSALRIYAKAYGTASPDVPQEEKAWPGTTPLHQFGSPYEGPDMRCGVVDGAELEKVRKSLQESNELTPWTSNGKRYLLILRPLLPGETGCSAP